MKPKKTRKIFAKQTKMPFAQDRKGGRPLTDRVLFTAFIDADTFLRIEAACISNRLNRRELLERMMLTMEAR